MYCFIDLLKQKLIKIVDLLECGEDTKHCCCFPWTYKVSVPTWSLVWIMSWSGSVLP